MAHNNYFQFKQFRIEQNHAAMRVGTDGVLLGSWVDIQNISTILDIGTGTGIIALMLAQRTNANIMAIDISAEAIKDAESNFRNSPWSNRLKLQHISVQEYVGIRGKYFDCICCNPPFFQNGIQSENDHRKLARHTASLSFDELIEGAELLLSEKGSFNVILPVDCEKAFCEKANRVGLFTSRKTYIRPNTSKPIKRILLRFEKVVKPVEIDELVIESEVRHVYTPQYSELVKEFYLNL